MPIDREMLRRLDLNLLVAFDVLISEGNVTRAAERMSVGQPAMSASLTRLRRFFDDPLLVRQGRTLVPTTRALLLIEPLREALNDIESTLNIARHFDAQTSDRTFRLMASDAVLLLLLGPLLAELCEEAPKVKFQIHPLAANYVQMVERFQLDLLLYPDELIAPDSELCSEMLYVDRLVCVVGADHPDVGNTMTIDQFRTLPSVSYGGDSDTVSSRRFREQGIDRAVEILAQSFVVQPLLLPGTRLMSVLPERLARHFEGQVAIRILEPPVKLAPLTEGMYWSPRAEADPAQRWLRLRLQEAAKRMPKYQLQ